MTNSEFIVKNEILSPKSPPPKLICIITDMTVASGGCSSQIQIRGLPGGNTGGILISLFSLILSVRTINRIQSFRLIITCICDLVSVCFLT